MPSKRTPATRTRKRRRLRRPSPLTLLWGVVSLTLAIALVIVQGVLLLTFTLLSVAVTALSAWTDQRDSDPAVPTPKPTKPKSASPRGDRRSAAAVPPCTNTGRGIDVCPCSERHVRSSDGARRYKRAIGAPMGGKAAPKKAGTGTGTTKPSTTKKADT